MNVDPVGTGVRVVRSEPCGVLYFARAPIGEPGRGGGSRWPRPVNVMTLIYQYDIVTFHDIAHDCDDKCCDIATMS